jgi:hypothetical protein
MGGGEMTNHLVNANKMVSDTPRTDAAWKPDGGDGYPTVDADFSRKLERELNRACEMYRKLDIHTLNLVDRIRRLEEAGGLALCYAAKGDFDSADEVWRKAKEAKL